MRVMKNGKGLTMAQMSGAPVEVVHAPENDAVYVLAQREGETGTAILVYALVYTSYMPATGSAQAWVAADRDRVRTGAQEA